MAFGQWRKPFRRKPGPPLTDRFGKRNPADFVFSISERVFADMVPLLSKFEEPGFESGYFGSLSILI